MDDQTISRLKLMLGVPIDRVEDTGGTVIVYVPRDKVGRAVGQGGAVVRATELVLGLKLKIKPSS
jgi:transcription antitermination factor NusA-like protein